MPFEVSFLAHITQRVQKLSFVEMQGLAPSTPHMRAHAARAPEVVVREESGKECRSAISFSEFSLCGSGHKFGVILKLLSAPYAEEM